MKNFSPLLEVYAIITYLRVKETKTLVKFSIFITPLRSLPISELRRRKPSTFFQYGHWVRPIITYLRVKETKTSVNFVINSLRVMRSLPISELRRRKP